MKSQVLVSRVLVKRSWSIDVGKKDSSFAPPPPLLCPANNRILTKDGPNRSVCWTRRSVPNSFRTSARYQIKQVPKTYGPN